MQIGYSGIFLILGPKIDVECFWKNANADRHETNPMQIKIEIILSFPKKNQQNKNLMKIFLNMKILHYL